MTSSAGRRRVRLARGASPWLVPVVAVTAYAGAKALRSPRWAAVALPLAALSGAMLSFFRDPDRAAGEGRLLSPADGTVQSITPWPDGRTRVAIFMSPLNVHVNRAPCPAIVRSVEHVAGGYLPAFNKDSDRNERVVWNLDTEFGDLELVQIAGAVARRIVPYIGVGSKVGRAERIGLIRFGSRVDVYLPEGMAPAVTVGERTRAGQTRLDRAEGKLNGH